MNRPSMLLSILGIATAIALTVWFMGSHIDTARGPSSSGFPWSHAAGDRVAAGPDTEAGRNSQSPAVPSHRAHLRAARDYAAFFKEIAPAALSGDPEAGYVVAKLLRYCRKSLGAFFIRPDGGIRTIDEVQARRARVPAGISQQELLDIYDRCHGFLDDPEFVRDRDPWKSWLDRAAELNYPAAVAEQAAERYSESMLSGGEANRNDDHDRYLSTRDAALSAAETGDPDAIFGMADWIADRPGRTSEDIETLTSAWQILACRKGYDCGAGSDWIRSVCNWDPQCAEGQTYDDYFQRHLGTAYDDALRLADRISSALASRNRAALDEFF